MAQEERIAKFEGLVEQMNERLNSIEGRLNRVESRLTQLLYAMISMWVPSFWPFSSSRNS